MEFNYNNTLSSGSVNNPAGYRDFLQSWMSCYGYAEYSNNAIPQLISTIENNPSSALFHDPIAEVVFAQQLHRFFAGSNISANRIVDTNLGGKFHYEIAIPLRIPSDAQRI
jgi:hypothetical protein